MPLDQFGSARAFAQEQVLSHISMVSITAGLAFRLPIRRLAAQLERGSLAARGITSAFLANTP